MLNSHTFNVRYLEYIRTDGFLEFQNAKIHTFSEQFKDFKSTVAEIDAKIRFKLYEERFFADEHLADCVIYKFKIPVYDDEFQQRLLDFVKGGRCSQFILNEELLDYIFFDAENLGNIPNETQVSLSNEAYHFVVVREIVSHLFTPIEAMVQNTRYFDNLKPHQFLFNPESHLTKHLNFRRFACNVGFYESLFGV
ncbi:hypothetical protein HK096_009930 [Nowakowskiella sp. JEL0078]|nr:hypothetical protein HK096_009930 [Nowakowskiella sp. JEL0078]